MRVALVGWLLMGSAGCIADPEPSVATYRISGHLVPGRPGICGECSVVLALEAVRTDDTRVRARFSPGTGGAAGFRFRWGVEQVVEVTTEHYDVSDGLQDDPGVKQYVSRVVEERVLPAGTAFEIPFRTSPPGTFGVTLERQDQEVVLEDFMGTSVRLRCGSADLCAQLEELEPGAQAFTLSLTHSGTPDDPATIHGLQLTP